MTRYFTLQEAEAVLPKVERAIRDALFLKSEWQQTDEALDAQTRRINMSGGSNVNRDQILKMREQRDSVGRRLHEGMEAIHAYGCEVKDLDIGLLDFPALFRGQEVLLCWKLGESRIEWWHGLTEGFRGRKRIDAEFINGLERAGVM